LKEKLKFKGKLMHHITLSSETDFDGWRKAARALVLNQVKSPEVIWSVRGHAAKPVEPSSTLLEPVRDTFKVPARFVALVQSVTLHRDNERFVLLYHLLWRLRTRHDLLDIAVDPDVALAHAMAKAVHRDMQRMHTSLRFREIGREQKAHYVAWFEPEHHIVVAAAPFFALRYADMPWSILTPDICAHWNGHAVVVTPGIDKTDTSGPNRLEENWRRHSAGLFNPARLKVQS
jgi:DNA polymerase